MASLTYAHNASTQRSIRQNLLLSTSGRICGAPSVAILVQFFPHEVGVQGGFTTALTNCRLILRCQILTCIDLKQCQHLKRTTPLQRCHVCHLQFKFSNLSKKLRLHLSMKFAAHLLTLQFTATLQPPFLVYL